MNKQKNKKTNLHSTRCAVSIILLFLLMQVGTSTTYVGFGLAVVAAFGALFHSIELRWSLIDLVKRKKSVWILLGLYLLISSVVMLVQQVTSLRSWGELKWIFFFIGLLSCVMTFAGDWNRLNQRKVKLALYILFGMILFTTFAAMYQFTTHTDPFRDFLGQSKTVNLARGHGLLRNPVPFGKLMGGLGLISIAGFLISSLCRSRRWKLLSGISAAVCGLSVIASQTRGSWVALALVGVIGVIAVPSILRKEWFLGVVMCGVLVVVAFWSVPALNSRAIELVHDNVQKSNQTRLEQWHINWMILKENPLGVGFDGNDLREDYWYEKLGYVKRVTGHCHNEFLEIAVANGWLGFVPYLGLTLLFLWLPMTVLRKIRVTEQPVLSFLLLASFLVQIFLNGAVMTDQMDTQSRMMMSVAWAVSLAGWYMFFVKGEGESNESKTGSLTSDKKWKTE